MPQLRSSQLAVMSLILTPETIREFLEKAGKAVDGQATIALHERALNKSFKPVARARSAPDFRERWSSGVSTYSDALIQILEALLMQLGPSSFRTAYLRQLSAVSKQLERLHFGVHDISELFRRHVACSTKLSSNYEELCASEPKRVQAVVNLLWSSNYGITFLYLSLSGHLESSSWVFLEANTKTLSVIKRCEEGLLLGAPTYHLMGSLPIRDEEFDLFGGDDDK